MANLSWLTPGIALGIGSLLVYAVFVFRQTRTMRRQNLVMQESEWIPEIFFDAAEDLIGTRGRRPWFPEFKAEVGGEENEDGWVDATFYPVAPDMSLHEVEWKTELPPHIRSFLRQLPEGDCRGKLHFKFETFTGEEYRLIYDIRLHITEHEYEIVEYPDMDRRLPWDQPDWWDRIRNRI